MNSLNSLWHSLLSAFSRMLVLAAGRNTRRALDSYWGRTSGAFIDSRVVAEAMNVSRSAARAKLEYAVKRGELQRVLLYLGDDAPAPIEVQESEIGAQITLGQAGFVEDSDVEIILRPAHIKEVYCVRTAV